MFISIPGFCPLGASSNPPTPSLVVTKMSPDSAKCPLAWREGVRAHTHTHTHTLTFENRCCNGKSTGFGALYVAFNCEFSGTCQLDLASFLKCERHNSFLFYFLMFIVSLFLITTMWNITPISFNEEMVKQTTVCPYY
uniref:Uncharacterized protein n=1 Tax=Molossus molossus TaxID=27622 RepID=A0A7J8JW69_MOLMO|nr:hypothetical protein HJG59_008086 [Molossus molossus]